MFQAEEAVEQRGLEGVRGHYAFSSRRKATGKAFEGRDGQNGAGEEIRSRSCRSCRLVDFYLRIMESSHGELFNPLSKQE